MGEHSTLRLSESSLKRTTDCTSEYNQLANKARQANCIALNEYKRFLDESALLWSTQLFSIRACIENMTKSKDNVLAKTKASTTKKKATTSASSTKSPRVGDKRDRSTSPDVERTKPKRKSSIKDDNAKASSTTVDDTTTDQPSTPRVDEEPTEELARAQTPLVDHGSTLKTKVNSPSPTPSEMVDYDSSPEQKVDIESAKAMSEAERRAKLRSDLGSSDDEEPGEIQRERSRDRSPSRLRSRSRSRSSPRTITRDEYHAQNRDRPRPQARARSRSPSDDRYPQYWPGDYGRRLPDISNSADEEEELNASVLHRINHWPWMVYWENTKQWRGMKHPPQRHIQRLYDCSVFRKRAIDRHNAIRRDADANVSDKEFISLFLEHRFLKSKKANNKPSLESACQAWNMFVSNYLADPEHWRKRLQVARTDHTHSIPGMRLEIHRLCVESNLPCMILQESCETCGPNGPKMPGGVLTPDNCRASDARLADRVPTILWNLFGKYEQALARYPLTSGVSDRNRTQGQARPRVGRDVAPTSRGRADSLSSEQDMFASDPFSLDYDGQGAFQQSTSLHHSSRGVVGVEKGRPAHERRLVSASESSRSQHSQRYPSVPRDQSSDYEARIAKLERTVEELLDLDLRLTESQRDHKILLRELQQAGVHLPRFDRDKVEADLRRK